MADGLQHPHVGLSTLRALRSHPDREVPELDSAQELVLGRVACLDDASTKALLMDLLRSRPVLLEECERYMTAVELSFSMESEDGLGGMQVAEEEEEGRGGAAAAQIGTTTCSLCGHSQDAAAKFCEECGGDIRAKTPASSSRTSRREGMCLDRVSPILAL